ncbi:hypothetical protein MNBD_GAMMA10-996 [hydrothermal vent metagenome]|uniref:Uncharacterized protein n=1 Tax=hydrothermal vent metagenome TaxID=652676 RepID=A0A3B0YBW1_9ZZZZ
MINKLFATMRSVVFQVKCHKQGEMGYELTLSQEVKLLSLLNPKFIG